VEKGTTNGTSTDSDGKFALTVGDNAVLQISYVGYVTQEIKVGNQTALNITLQEDAQALEEVVVVGYGVAKKSDLTGAVVRADLSVMQNAAKVNALADIKGVVPGLNVGVATQAGDDPGVSIRGRNSISGTTNPLIVLDGIIYRGSITDINPSDIESIDVLKDASSSAIYGSQATNGVLQITTRNAQVMSKPVIEYSGTFTSQALIKNLELLDRDGFIQFLTDSHMDKSRTGLDMHPNPDYDVISDLLSSEDINGYRNGTNTNWFNLLKADNPYIQNHNFSIRGRNELVTYYLSFGLTDQQNIIKNDTINDIISAPILMPK